MHIRTYARDNVGNKMFTNNKLLRIANEIQQISDKYKDRKKMFKKIKKILEGTEFKRGEGYKINEEENKIVLYDKKLQVNKYGVVECSWGYEEIEITFLDEEAGLLQALKEIIKKIKDDDEYEVISDVAPCGLLSGAFGDFVNDNVFEKYIETEISGKELKEYLKDWVSYVKKIDKESPGFADGMEVDEVPVCSNNPFEYAGDGWSFEGDENELTIKASYTALAGAHYHKFHEYISFIKITKKEV